MIHWELIFCKKTRSGTLHLKYYVKVVWTWNKNLKSFRITKSLVVTISRVTLILSVTLWVHFMAFDPSKHFKNHLITVISPSMSDRSNAIPTLFPLWRFFIVPTNYEVEMIVCISLIHFWSHRIKKRKSKIAFHLFSFFHCHSMCRCFCLGKLQVISSSDLKKCNLQGPFSS